MTLEDAAILVIGSINMDLAASCPRIPRPGETVLGTSLLESPGGKGANQAVAAGLLGGAVSMTGCVGADAFGPALRRSLARAGVGVDRVLVRGDRSGLALIAVSERGENSILVVPGANALVDPDDVDATYRASPGARVVLLQLELPLATITSAAQLAHARGIQVILDPAPAPTTPLPADLLNQIDVITPNQSEAGSMTSIGVNTIDEAREAAHRLLARGPRTALVKLGAGGVLIVSQSGERHISGRRVDVVDTTGAGDCLAGALAVALTEGRSLDEAVIFANAAAALSTTRRGAQEAMPTRSEVDSFLGGAWPR
jgi:ribokinase